MRVLTLKLNDKYYDFNFDEYSLMLYYAKKLNEARALVLYKSTVSEYFYKHLRGISVGSLTSEDENVAITIAEIPDVISFINAVIIPSLMLETQGLMQKFGGTNSFDNLFTIETGFTEDIFLNEVYQPDDSDKYSKDSIVGCFEYLRDFLQYALIKNTSYDVSVS